MKLVLEAFQYLKDVKSNYRDVYDIEEERSACEQQLLSYKNSAFTLLKEVKDSNLGQQNFIRLLQGLYIRALKLHSYNSKNNTMIYNILENIRRLKSYMELINDYSNNYQALSTISAQANNSGKRNNSKNKASQQNSSNIQTLVNNAGIANGETNLLKVSIKKHNKEIVLFKGQCINTPMGIGTITCIKPKELKVVLKLPYGVLYAHVAKVVSWGNHGDALDVTSSYSLHNKLSSINNISIDQLTQVKINQSINNESNENTVSEQVDDNTDNDDDNSNSKENGETEGNENAMDVVTNEEEEAVEDSIDKLPKYPLQPTVKCNKRADFSKSLNNELLTRPHSLIALPFATIAPNTIPYVVENIDKSYMNANISINTNALNKLKHTYCSSSHHVWNGTVEDYQSQINKIKDEIVKLEKEQQDYMNQIQSYRMQYAQLTSDTSMVRLGMYTRRMRHKTYLASNGFQSPISGATTSSTAEALVLSSDKATKHVNEDAKNGQVSSSQSVSNDIIAAPANKKRNREQANLVINDKANSEKNSKKESTPPIVEKVSETPAVNTVNNNKKKSRR